MHIISCPFSLYNTIIYSGPIQISRDAPCTKNKHCSCSFAILSFSDSAYGITDKSYQIIQLNSGAVCSFVCPTLISLTKDWKANHEFSSNPSPLSLWVASIFPNCILSLGNCFRKLMISGALSFYPLVGTLQRKKPSGIMAVEQLENLN